MWDMRDCGGEMKKETGIEFSEANSDDAVDELISDLWWMAREDEDGAVWKMMKKTENQNETKSEWNMTRDAMSDNWARNKYGEIDKTKWNELTKKVDETRK